ncbi:MAG: oligopeptide/dipeptide ABC transporter ATP-binding protein [Opitutales bacterium]
MDTDSPLLTIEDLRIRFRDRDRVNEAVKGINFELQKGETLAVVGESGSGKSVSAMSITKLLPAPPACEITGKIEFEGRNMLELSKNDLRSIRGKDIAYIFQEPSSSLNPYMRVSDQIGEAIKLHRPDVKDVRGKIIETLDLVGIRDAAKRYRDYPHQMSGGMKQRVMIAMALVCEPKILIADEPTTALDVTIQAQILDLMAELKSRLDMSIILITHNFGIVDGFADRLVVMFRGNIVEFGKTEEVLQNPQHPYTKALIDCIPKLGTKQERLATIDHAALVEIT